VAFFSTDSIFSYFMLEASWSQGLTVAQVKVILSLKQHLVSQSKLKLQQSPTGMLPMGAVTMQLFAWVSQIVANKIRMTFIFN
jgi:hypothetical protein